MIYQNLPLRKWEVIFDPMHTVARKSTCEPGKFDPYDSNIVLPSSYLPLLMVNHQMSEETNWNDKAIWITRRLQGLGSKAKLIKKVKIVFEIYSPHSRSYFSEYTPSIQAIMDKVEECCDFQLADGYVHSPTTGSPLSLFYGKPRFGGAVS
jgi:hypothetical protein